MRYIDLFAGIGGFRQAFDNEGYECVFTSEFNPSCQKVYEENYGNKPSGDITKINAKDIPDFDVLCAGIPCQPFSSCGKHKGFEDTRGTLFFDVCRIISEKKPKIVLIENVTGLVYHDNGNTFKVIKETLESLGYIVSSSILHATDFGLAQARERIIIVAADRLFNFTFEKTKKVKVEDILEENDEYIDKASYTILNETKEQPSGLIFAGYMNKNTRKGTNSDLRLSRAHKQPNRIYSTKGTYPTIPSQESAGRFYIYIPEKDAVRKLTLKEVYRLFGFPDDFKRASSKGEAYNR